MIIVMFFSQTVLVFALVSNSASQLSNCDFVNKEDHSNNCFNSTICLGSCLQTTHLPGQSSCTLFPLGQPLLVRVSEHRASEALGESKADHQQKQQDELHPEREIS